MHRISLTAMARRRLSWIFGLVFVMAAVVAAPKVALAADPKIEKEAQALEKKAIEEDNLNVNYAGAIKKLQSALTKCDGDKCNSAIKAALLRDVGAMQVLNGSVDEGKASFGQAIGMDAAIELDPAYKNPQLEGIWNEVKKKGGGAAPPVKAGPQPTGDFVHSPPTEALVRTPLPVYVEYSGSEELTRVTVKYKGFGQPDWKTIELKKTDSGFGAMIPCKDVTQGLMQYFVQGFSDQHDPVATSGTRTKPFTVPVSLQISGPAPSLPGEEPPEQCADTECPPDFPGCGGKKKHGGDDCSKDAECESSSCVDDKCVDKKASGDDCASDTECNSGTCTSGKCAGKKAEGDECDADEDCDSDKCSEGKCTAGASSSGKVPKLWIGLAAQADIFFMPGANDVCVVPPAGPFNSAGYSCLDPGTGKSFPSRDATGLAIDREIRAGASDQVVGGLKLGNIRLMLSVDYALSHNVLLGARAGYVLSTAPAGSAFAPLHLEARLTYLVGKDAVGKKGLSPMVFAGVGAGEFDAFVPVNVAITCMGTPKGCTPGKVLTGTENAWLTAGPAFFSLGGGARVLFAPKVALTAALKFEGAFGGAAGFLPGIAPELGLQFGF